MIKYVITFTLLALVSLNIYSLDLNQEDFIQILKKSHRQLPFHGNILIKQGDKELFKHTSGLANREWNVENTFESKFMIASLTKQFTAYAILKLAKEGKLKLSDTLDHYIKLPKNSLTSLEKWKNITIENLLTHTGGIIRDVPKVQHMSPSDYNLTNAIIVSTLQGKDIAFKQPGQFYYSNLGYLLLAQIIEKTAKSIYITYLNNHIFRPLGMTSTGEFHRIKIIENMTSGYFYNDRYKAKKRCCRDASTYKGSHGLYSTMSDLALWQQELNSPKLLDKSIIEQMHQNHIHIEKQTYYGYGLYRTQDGQSINTWHPGHENGYVSLLSYIKKYDLTVIFLANSHGHEAHSDKPNSLRFQEKLLEKIATQ